MLLNALLRDDASLVADVTLKNVQPVEETDPLIAVLEKAMPRDGDTIPVTKAGTLTSLLDLKRVFHLAKTRASLQKFAQQSAARALTNQAIKVTVFEKSRKVAGRMATRRTSKGPRFDHGAQYFTV